MNNPRFPHWIVVKRESAPENPFGTAPTPTVIYNGEGRRYSQSSTDGDTKVITSNRMISIPGFYDSIRTGDQVEVNIGTIYERGVILDVLPGNLGTTLIYDYVRN